MANAAHGMDQRALKPVSSPHEDVASIHALAVAAQETSSDRRKESWQAFQSGRIHQLAAEGIPEAYENASEHDLFARWGSTAGKRPARASSSQAELGNSLVTFPLKTAQ
jgi:hypothetical protein